MNDLAPVHPQLGRQLRDLKPRLPLQGFKNELAERRFARHVAFPKSFPAPVREHCYEALG